MVHRRSRHPHVDSSMVAGDDRKGWCGMNELGAIAGGVACGIVAAVPVSLLLLWVYARWLR